MNNSITLEVSHAITFKQKLLGLIGKDKIEPLLLETRFGIHTFFMQQPIDVIVLDKLNIVQTLRENLQSNKFFFWNPRYNTVIELPSGTIKKKELKIGKKIELKKK